MVATLRVPPGGCSHNPRRGAEHQLGVLDLSGAYRRAFDVALPHAGGVADPFHVIRLANNSIDEVRRRVQNDTFGHRGRKDDPLYRARRLLISAHERLTEGGDAKLRGLLAYFDERLTNGPTEGVNRIIKAVKRQGFGYTNADNYRIRVLYRCA